MRHMVMVGSSVEKRRRTTAATESPMYRLAHMECTASFAFRVQSSFGQPLRTCQCQTLRIACSAIVMVSLKHEGLVTLVRDRPAFAADLLGELLAVKVPPFSKARLVDVTLNQVKPAEYRADAVVLFT